MAQCSLVRSFIRLYFKSHKSPFFTSYFSWPTGQLKCMQVVTHKRCRQRETCTLREGERLRKMLATLRGGNLLLAYSAHLALVQLIFGCKRLICGHRKKKKEKKMRMWFSRVQLDEPPEWSKSSIGTRAIDRCNLRMSLAVYAYLPPSLPSSLSFSLSLVYSIQGRPSVRTN